MLGRDIPGLLFWQELVDHNGTYAIILRCRLREIRTERGWTQDDLALFLRQRGLRISANHISRWENHRGYPQIVTAYQISHALQVPITDVWQFKIS